MLTNLLLRFKLASGCEFDSAGKGTCDTGDCGGALKCGGSGGNPPATLAEITLHGADGNDFYDISLVDGYNLPLAMTPAGGTGKCGAPECSSNLNDMCPEVLQVCVLVVATLSVIVIHLFLSSPCKIKPRALSPTTFVVLLVVLDMETS